MVFLCLAVFLSGNTKIYALDKKETFALSHYIMAVMYEQLGDIDKAILEYQKALKADRSNILIHIRLAANYIRADKNPQAIKELKLAAQLDPQAVEPHAILALLYSSEENFGLATEEYEIALKNASKLDPKNVDIYRSLGLVYLQQKKFEEAKKAYNMLLEISHSDSEAHFYLGSIYGITKDHKLEEEHIKKALHLRPDYPQALNYLGYLYTEENKNLDQAEIMIKKALEVEPENGAYIDSLGWLYFKKGKLDDSLRMLEKASMLMDDPVIYDHLGDVYFKKGNIDKARENWEKSIALNQEQDSIIKKIEALPR